MLLVFNGRIFQQAQNQGSFPWVYALCAAAIGDRTHKWVWLCGTKFADATHDGDKEIKRGVM